jgi:glycine cleavage system H protein
MASAPTDLRYLPTHEWHRIEGDTATIGITQFAADELTDITFVGFKVKAGDRIDANGRFGEIESVKTTSDLYSGVGGTVVAVNDQLASDPGLVNSDPYSKGWMVKIKLSNPADAQKLLSAEDYLKKTGH